MDKCNDYWCENYGANNAKCAECKSQDIGKDTPDLRVLFMRKQMEQMEAMRHIRGKDYGNTR